ncbi:putative reverse transcriptase zinc-binding domain-containing protein [Helianthus annuus]|nr:putative reverse transcriptase zinc-binding domain-containing protein [Helianthus annuus]
MFLGKWSYNNFLNLRRILRCFYLTSGLKVNLLKCNVYGIGVSEMEIQHMANIIDCKKGSFPFKHLGLTVGANMNLTRNWDPVIDTFRSRLSIWKAKHLSYGGRITLLKSVLNSLPTYYFSLFKAPIQVIDSLERIRQVFFWGGDEEKAKMNWVAWEKTIAPVEYGGLGFGSLKDANLAMLAKWWWRFRVQREGLWRNVIWAFHHNNRSWAAIPVKVSITGPWKQIVSINDILARRGIDLRTAIKAVVADGLNTPFWLDNWLGDTSLNIRFPSLFSLEKNKLCTVSNRIRTNSSGPLITWDWARPITDGSESAEFQVLLGLLSVVVVSQGVDKQVWNMDDTGLFSVSSIKKILSSTDRTLPSRIFSWNNWIPKKVGMVAWRAEKDRLPTREALIRRQINITDASCVLCGECMESSEHLFVACHFAQTVWQNIASWCKIPPIVAFDFKDLLDLHDFSSGPQKRKKTMQAIFHIVIWCIWKTRNEVIFRNSQPNVIKVLEEVKSLGYLWVKNRSRETSITWEGWSRFSVFE